VKVNVDIYVQIYQKIFFNSIKTQILVV